MSAIKEIRSLTGLRGIAAIYVMIFHFWFGVSQTNPLSRLLGHGYLAVDLFFILSGFVMTLNYTELFRGGWSWVAFRSFLARRIARLYPLYLAATLLGIMVLAANLSQDPWDAHRGWEIVENLTMIQVWGLGSSLAPSSWSLSAEWAAYLIFPFLLWLGFQPDSRRTRFAAFTSVACLAGICFLPSALVHRTNPGGYLDLHHQYHGWALARCLPEFFLGIVAARVFVQQRAERLRSSSAVAYVVCLALIAVLCLPGTDLVVAVLAPMLILVLTSPENLASRVLGSPILYHFGLLSYSMYLIHPLFGGAVERIHRLATMHGWQHGQTWGALAAFGLTYPLSLLAYFTVEKPGRDVLRRVLEPQKASAPKISLPGFDGPLQREPVR